MGGGGIKVIKNKLKNGWKSGKRALPSHMYHRTS
jgi:hypothetical protein